MDREKPVRMGKVLKVGNEGFNCLNGMGKDSNHGNRLWLVRRVVPSSLIDVSSGFMNEERKNSPRGSMGNVSMNVGNFKVEKDLLKCDVCEGVWH